MFYLDSEQQALLLGWGSAGVGSDRAVARDLRKAGFRLTRASFCATPPSSALTARCAWWCSSIVLRLDLSRFFVVLFAALRLDAAAVVPADGGPPGGRHPPRIRRARIT